MQSKTLSSEQRALPALSATLFRKNLARFWPLWLTYTVIWALVVPVDLFLQLQSSHRYADTLPGELEMSQYILGRTFSIAPVMALIFGCLMAMALFSYLCTPRSVGFLHTLPIRRGGLFWTNYLSGLFMFFSAHAVIALLTLLAMTGEELRIGGKIDGVEWVSC